ncbi:RNA polymerase sigma factor [Spirosoma gilvum]
MENLMLSVSKASTAIKTNDLGNFESIYNRYVGKVYQKCLAMTKDPEASKDFTQDIFIKVFFKLSTFQNRSTLSTWLYSVAHNYCLDQLRLNRRTHTELLSDSTADRVTESDTSTASQWQALESMMNELPPQEVMLLKLKYEQGLSVKAISERYKLSESAVKMRLLRTRDKLQTMYATLYNH